MSVFASATRLDPALLGLIFGARTLLYSTLPVFRFSECVLMLPLLYHPDFHGYFMAVSIHVICLSFVLLPLLLQVSALFV